MEIALWLAYGCVFVLGATCIFLWQHCRKLERKVEELERRQMTFTKREEKTFKDIEFAKPAETRSRITTAHLSAPRKQKKFEQS